MSFDEPPRTLLLLVILAVIPAICIEIYGETQLRATRQQEISQEASRLMRLAAAEQQRINEGARQLLVAFSAGQSVRAKDWSACNELAQLIRARVQGYVNIGVASPDGNLLCSALPVPPAKDMQRRSLPRGHDGRRRFVYRRLSCRPDHGKKVITYALPLRDDRGAVIAVAWANIDLDWLARHFADRFTSPNMTLLITDRAGTILLRLPDTETWVGKPIGERYMPMVQAAERRRRGR